MWHLFDAFGKDYKSITWYKEMEITVTEAVISELKQDLEDEELYNKAVNKILEWENKWNWVVELLRWSAKVYL